MVGWHNVTSNPSVLSDLIRSDTMNVNLRVRALWIDSEHQ